MPVQPHVHRPLVLVQRLGALEAFPADVTLDLGRHGMNPEHVTLQKLGPSEDFFAL